MMPKRFCRRPYDDRGASLVLALVFVTVVSIVVMAVIALAEANLRTTVQLRADLADAAAAEGAAQIATNALRTNGYPGTGNCFIADPYVELASFNDGPDSLRVDCERDDASSTAPMPTLPPRAILATWPNSGGPLVPPGLQVQGALSGATRYFSVAGDVVTNSDVDVGARRSLNTTGALRARFGCSGTIVPASCPSTGTPVTDPGSYPLPTGTTAPQTPAPCPSESNRIVTLQPGFYGSTAGLDALTSRDITRPRCANLVVHMIPGTYYFDFSGSDTTWDIESGWVIGGTLTNAPLTPGGQPVPMPGACVSPYPSGAGWTPAPGVELVFAWDSTIRVANNARVELCGSYSTSRPPIVIYGLPTTMPRQGGGLIRAIRCAITNCPVLTTQSFVGSQMLRIEGTVYIPNNDVRLDLIDSSDQRYRGGIIARRVSVATQRTSPAVATVELPVTSGPLRTVVWLTVFRCRGASQCDSGGEQEIRARVLIEDPSGVPNPATRTVKILSWTRP
jgi:hypothetical protein